MHIHMMGRQVAILHFNSLAVSVVLTGGLIFLDIFFVGNNKLKRSRILSSAPTLFTLHTNDYPD